MGLILDDLFTSEFSGSEIALQDHVIDGQPSYAWEPLDVDSGEGIRILSVYTYPTSAGATSLNNSTANKHAIYELTGFTPSTGANSWRLDANLIWLPSSNEVPLILLLNRTSTTSYYAARITTDTLKLYKYASSTLTEVASTSHSIAANDSISFRTNDAGYLRLFVNDVLKATYTDGSPLTGTNFAFGYGNFLVSTDDLDYLLRISRLYFYDAVSVMGSGGCTFGGASSNRLGYRTTAAGQTNFGGGANCVIKSYRHAVEGSCLFGGSAGVDSSVKTFVGGGTVSFGGSAAASYGWTHRPTGGVRFGGTSSASFEIIPSDDSPSGPYGYRLAKHGNGYYFRILLPATWVTQNNYPGNLTSWFCATPTLDQIFDTFGTDFDSTLADEHGNQLSNWGGQYFYSYVDNPNLRVLEAEYASQDLRFEAGLVELNLVAKKAATIYYYFFNPDQTTKVSSLADTGNHWFLLGEPSDITNNSTCVATNFNSLQRFPFRGSTYVEIEGATEFDDFEVICNARVSQSVLSSDRCIFSLGHDDGCTFKVGVDWAGKPYAEVKTVDHGWKRIVSTTALAPTEITFFADQVVAQWINKERLTLFVNTVKAAEILFNGTDGYARAETSGNSSIGKSTLGDVWIGDIYRVSLTDVISPLGSLTETALVNYQAIADETTAYGGIQVSPAFGGIFEEEYFPRFVFETSGAVSFSGSLISRLSVSDSTAGTFSLAGNFAERISLADSIAGGFSFSGSYPLEVGASGLVRFGGSASTVHRATFSDTVSGSVTLSGVVPGRMAVSDTISGSIALGGVLGIQGSYADRISGGVSLSGSFSESHKPRFIASAGGGFRLTGSVVAGVRHSFFDAIAGTISLTGNFVDRIGRADSISGGFSIAGSSTEQIGIADQVAGAVAFSGTFVESTKPNYVVSTTGAVQFGGNTTTLVRHTYADSISGTIYLTPSDFIQIGFADEGEIEIAFSGLFQESSSVQIKSTGGISFVASADAIFTANYVDIIGGGIKFGGLKTLQGVLTVKPRFFCRLEISSLEPTINVRPRTYARV